MILFRRFHFFTLFVLILWHFTNAEDLDVTFGNDDDIPIIEGDGGPLNIFVEEDVLVLTKDNFDLTVMAKDIILVEFYAPWCGHCKSLAPEYSKAAKLLKENHPIIPLAKVDATVETEIASRYDVTGYPTLFIFRKGNKYPYDGPRSAMGIADYMKEQADPNWKPLPDSTIILTSENFTDTVNNADLILVEFYAPWCGHCKRLAPEYERAARKLKELTPHIPLAKIDGTAEKELADKYDAHGWPTLMLFRKGRKYKYEGPRDELGIVSYMQEQSRSPSSEMLGAKALQKAFSKDEITVVGFFKDFNEPLFLQFIEAANNYRGKFKFIHTFDEKSREVFKVPELSIAIFQPEIFKSNYESSKHVFSKADGSYEEVNQFIDKHMLPLVGHRTMANRWKYENKYPLLVVYYDVDFSFDHRSQTQLIRKEISKVAKDFLGEITFAISNENEYEQELVDLHLDDSGEDVNVGYFLSPKKRYKMEPDEEFSSEILKQFVENVRAGKVSPYIKSQPVPKDNKSPVQVVVGSTFEKLVTESDKDILLEFYAPWCGHCQALEPTYKKLAKLYASNKRIVIAKIDATANDFPEDYAITGFPTIYYIPSSDKTKLVTYSGGRTLKELETFVENNLGKREESNQTSRDEL